MALTRDLAHRAAAMGEDDIDDSAMAAACRLILDGLAVARAGAGEHAPRQLLELQAELAAPGRASVIGFGIGLTPAAAASVNGASMHVLDFEAMWSPPNHATSTTLPAALALAESHGFAGRDVAVALVKGVEMQGRLLAASGVYEPRDFRFQPPGFVGPLGAAVAAGHLQGLDGYALASALGIAASRAGSLLANAGTMTKCLHCGLAAAHGVEAALLASRGFTANAGIIEAPNGYGETFMPRLDHDFLLAFGEPWRIAEPGYAIKRFPCQYGTHFAINAALELAPKIASPDDIAEIRITGPVMPYVDRPKPRDGLDGKFSFQYTTAVALIDGAVGINSFSDARRFSPGLEATLGKVQFKQRENIPGGFEAMHVEVDVGLADGRRLKARCEKPRGYITGPRLSEEEHLQKIRGCLTDRMEAADAEACIERCRQFHTLSPAELSELMLMLRRG